MFLSFFRVSFSGKFKVSIFFSGIYSPDVASAAHKHQDEQQEED
jgi:hypothetical protein